MLVQIQISGGSAGPKLYGRRYIFRWTVSAENVKPIHGLLGSIYGPNGTGNVKQSDLQGYQVIMNIGAMEEPPKILGEAENQRKVYKSLNA